MGAAGTQLGSLVSHYGYIAVAAIVLAENLGLPVPGETAVFAAGAAAAAGELNALIVWVLVACAAIVGDNMGFAIGHFGGKPLIKRYGPRFGISAENYAATERFFDRFGGPAVLVARFIVIVRVIAALVAGSSGMRWRHFWPWQSLGAMLWAGYAVAVGYYGTRVTAMLKPILIARAGRWWPLVIVAAGALALGTLSLISHLIARRALAQSAEPPFDEEDLID